MNGQMIVAVALTALASWGFVCIVWSLARWLARRLNLRVQLRPDVPPAPVAPGPTWQAMVCGRRIELGDSGFYVTFNPEAGLARLYCLHTPEDEEVAWGRSCRA